MDGPNRLAGAEDPIVEPACPAFFVHKTLFQQGRILYNQLMLPTCADTDGPIGCLCVPGSESGH